MPVYAGPFGLAQAQRLLLRAGFGPTPGQSAVVAAQGLTRAVDALLNPGPATLAGPAPSGPYLVNGALAPATAWGHIHLQFLDRMVRSTDSLTERMTLVLHDWFAVSQTTADKPLVVQHLELLRSSWRGSFRDLLKAVTIDPAMLVYLDGFVNKKGAPNENYSREFMELYALGADRSAYTESDVRELARAFTGWKCDWTNAGRTNFRFDPNGADTGTKTIFAGKPYQRSGNIGVASGVDAVVDHPLHPTFVVTKLWAYFIPTAPSLETVTALSSLYRQNGERLDGIVRAILLHPDLYAGPSMVKPPSVHAAAAMRSRSAGITTDAWIGYVQQAGQLLGAPPNVSGWNDRAWLNTATVSARWRMAVELLKGRPALASDYVAAVESPEQAVAAAIAAWGDPILSDDHRAILLRLAGNEWIPGVIGDPYGSKAMFMANRQNLLRQLVLAGPDFQVS